MTSATPSGPTVSNTSCLIALEAIGRLELLSRQYHTLFIPSAVATEWGTIPPPWLKVQSLQNHATAQVLRLQLGAGEAEAVCLALEMNAQRLILDDRRARQIAAALGISVTGTVGIVLRAKQLGFIPLVQPVLHDLQQAGFWLSQALLRHALQLAGE